MHFQKFSFGSVQTDGRTCEHRAEIDHGEIRKRQKKPSKQFRDQFGHTPLSIEENIPWKCHQLVIGTGAYGKLPRCKKCGKAVRKKVKLLILPTTEVIEILNRDPKERNAILHVTC